jgi:hypothetical protein
VTKGELRGEKGEGRREKPGFCPDFPALLETRIVRIFMICAER